MNAVSKRVRDERSVLYKINAMRKFLKFDNYLYILINYTLNYTLNSTL